jgi:urease accessory protein
LLSRPADGVCEVQIQLEQGRSGLDMELPQSPFTTVSAPPGAGSIRLIRLPPDQQSLQTVTFQYPLKLISPDPHRAVDEGHVTVIFLLTYGGGLVGGDKINLKAELDDHTRLVLLTQGSTKIFKSPNRAVITGQVLDVKVGAGAALCYLPDPTQPFEESIYEQKQTFYVDSTGKSNLLVLDWVSEGRRARGESWTLWGWKGRNEVRAFDNSSKGRLLLRDAVTLTDTSLGNVGLIEKTNGMGIFGTLIIYGPLFLRLGQFFLDSFKAQPRIGAKDFSGDAKPVPQPVYDGLLWTAANVRGFVLVKFGARDLDNARQWLGGLLKQEGTVEKHFGHQALLCLR